MVYKKYVKRGGKVFGPYLYKSIKKDGRVITKYLGSVESSKSGNSLKKVTNEKINFSTILANEVALHEAKNKKNLRRKFLFLGMGVLIAIFLFLLLNYNLYNATGMAVLLIDDVYSSEENLDGILKLKLEPLEFIPSSANVVIGLNGSYQNYLLESLIDDIPQEGEFYIEGKPISGFGEGYGFSKGDYPKVSFVLDIYTDLEYSGENGESDSDSEPGKPEDIGKLDIEKSNDLKEQNEPEKTYEPGKPDEVGKPENAGKSDNAGKLDKPEKSNEKSEKKDKITGNILGFFIKLTGKLIGLDESENLSETEKSGKVRKSENIEKSDSIKEQNEIEESENLEKFDENNTDEIKRPEESEKLNETIKPFENNLNETGKSGNLEEFDESNTYEIEKPEKALKLKDVAIIGTKLEGEVSVKEPFTYTLSEGETARIVSSSEDVNMIIDGEKLTVTTKYLGEKKKELNIDLGKLNIPVQSGKLSVSFFYNDIELAKATKQIKIKDLIKNDTKETLNETTNITIIGNLTINTTQYKIVINRPVKWNKNVKLDEEASVRVELPKEAQNITVYKLVGEYREELEENNETEYQVTEQPSEQTPEQISESTEEQNSENEIKEATEEITDDVQKSENAGDGVADKEITDGETNKIKIPKKQKVSDDKIKITSRVISGKLSAEITEKPSFSGFFKKFFGFITGRAVEVVETPEVIEIIINENATEFEIEYETPGPISAETNISYGKEIIISSEIHYENILAYTELPKETPQSSIKLYHYENNSRNPANFIPYDLNNNTLIDYIEWIVPSLSNQTYLLIIEISRAEHLDSNREFISDIYNETRFLDGVWSEAINSNEYARVTFERNLTNQNDIKVYARSNKRNTIIEVYNYNSSELITISQEITDENYYAVNLSNMIGTHDVFDLRVTNQNPNAYLEFDYIVDPYGGPALSYVILNSTLGTNLTSENLTVNTDQDSNSSLKLIRNWYKNGEPMIILNMPFEGGSNSTFTKDYSNDSNNGTVINGSIWDSTGGYDGKGAYSFDGVNDFINLGYDDSLNFSGNFSLEILIKRQSSQPDSFPKLIWKPVGALSSGAGYLLFYATTTQKLYFRIATSSAVYNDVTSTITIAANKWYHIIGVREGNTIKTYINGVLNNQTTVSGINNIDRQVLRIGGYSSATSDFFNGTIDNVVIYNYSLSAQQVLALYNNRTDLIVSQETTKNENWSACVIPNDGTDDGTESCSNTLEILNTFPNATNVILNSTANANLTNGNLTGFWTFSDDDNDTQSQNETRWLNGTIEVTSLKNLTKITSGNLTANQNWTFSVRVYDGTNWSLWINSSNLIILNSLPTQSTPILNASDDPLNRTAANLTVYNQSTADIDNSVVKNIINWYKNNNSITLLNMPFEGGSNSTFTKDYTNYSYNATILINATWNLTGGYDGKGAYMFNGTLHPGSVKIPRILANYSNFTICAWIYPRSAPSFQVIATHGYTATGGNFGWDFYKTGATITLYVRNGTAPSGVGGGNTPVNQWSHACASFDNSTRNTTLYVNGVYITSENSSLNNYLRFTEDYFKIGARLNATENLPFNGTIDDVLLFRSVLSSQQIKAIYENKTNLIVSQETTTGNVWKACVTPNDGTGDGNESCSNNLTILNAIPNATNVILNSTANANLTNGNLTGYWTFSDGDGDSESLNETTWFNGTVEVTSLKNLTKITSGNLTANQNWTFSVRVYDGTDWSLWINSSNLIIISANTAPNDPVITLKSLDGSNKTSQDLNCSATLSDNEANKMNVTIMWFNNSVKSLVADFNNSYSNGTLFSAILDNGNLTVGHTWLCSMRLFDGVEYSNFVNSSNLTILNTFPNATNVILNSTANANLTNGNLTGYWTFSDDDNDTQSQNETMWFNGTVETTSLKNLTKITSGNLTANQNWTFSVRVYDGTNWSLWINSSNLIILNSLPTQSTPILNASDDPLNRTAANLTVYNQSTADIDNSVVKNIIDWKLNGNSTSFLNLPFEGGSNSTFTKDYTNNSKNGSVTGATWNSTGGYDGKGAYEFKGATASNKIILGNSTLFDFSNFSISAWIYNKGDAAGGGFGRIVTKDCSSSGGRSFSLEYSNDDDYFLLKLWNASSSRIDVSTSAISNNQWYHIAVTYNSTTGSIYLNGDLSSSSSNYGPVFDSSSNLTIGETSCGSPADSFNGTIDDVRIYNKGLSAQQVLALYQNKTNLIVAQETTKNENWTACITPNDGTSDGAESCSNTLTILNTEPNATNVILNSTANANLTNGNLTGYWTFSDVDTIDSESQNETAWLNGTVEVTSLKNLTKITSGNLTANQNWTFSVRVYDGTNWSLWINSSNLIILTTFVDINLTSFTNLQEIPRGNESYTGEDDLTIIPNLINITAKVYDNTTSDGVLNAVCFFFDNLTLLGNSTTNSSGDCFFNYDRVSKSSGIKELKVNYTVPSSETKSVNNSLVNISIVPYIMSLTATNLRSNGKYYDGDAAVLTINVTKTNSTVSNSSYDVQNISASSFNSGSQVRGSFYYPGGNITRTGTGLYSVNVTLVYGSGSNAFVRWETNSSDNNFASYLSSALHADVDVCSAVFGNWSDWSTCSGSTQSRTRTDTSNCIETQSQSCTTAITGTGAAAPTTPTIECTNECSPSGSVQFLCADINSVGSRTCGNFDSDSCLEWGTLVSVTCPQKMVCENAQCMEAVCNDAVDCSAWGECANKVQSRTCTNAKCETTRSCEVCTENWKCSWTECNGEEFSEPYGCVDFNNCGTQENKPTGQVSCAELPELISEEEIITYVPKKTGMVCSPDWDCAEWSGCNAKYTLEDVLSEKIATGGKKERACDDLTGCALDKFELRTCNLSIPVEARKGEWCQENYIEIFDKDADKLVSRFKESEIPEFKGLNRVDILFTSEFAGYCNYCYNGIKDYDETGVDCGGPFCQSCLKKIAFIDWLPLLILILWILFGIFVVAESVIERRGIKKKASESIKEIVRAAKPSAERERALEKGIEGLFKKMFVEMPQRILSALPRVKFKIRKRKPEFIEEVEIPTKVVKVPVEIPLRVPVAVPVKTEAEKLIEELEEKLKVWKSQGYHGYAALEKEIKELKRGSYGRKKIVKRFIERYREKRELKKEKKKIKKIEKQIIKKAKAEGKVKRKVIKRRIKELKGEVRKRKLLNLARKLRLWRKEGYYGTAELEEEINKLNKKFLAIRKI